MSSIWSDFVQKTGTLYLSRQLRFHDMFREKFTEAFLLPSDERLKILEVGCGPGALSQSLHRWYPSAGITGLDFDESFIEFALSGNIGNDCCRKRGLEQSRKALQKIRRGNRGREIQAK